MEIRERELAQLLAAEREQNALHEQRATELSTFLDEHRRLKGGWRDALTECNDKLEAQCHEAARLLVENRQLRGRLERAERRQQQQQQSFFGGSAAGDATAANVVDAGAEPQLASCYRIGRGNNVMFVTGGGRSGGAWGDSANVPKD